MERLPRGRYTREFRLEAVKLVEGGLSAYEVGRRLNVSDATISNWMRAYKAGKLGEVGKKALLSPRELAVVRLVGRGLQDKEIAHELGISEKTVQTYMQKLFAKLDTQNRTEAAVKAIRLGLL